MGHITARRDLYASKAASDFTSETYYTGDARSISLEVIGSPSTTTIQGTNADGRTTDLTNSTTQWSALSVIVSPSPDMIDIEAGYAYMRCLRSETTNVWLNVQNLV